MRFAHPTCSRPTGDALKPPDRNQTENQAATSKPNARGLFICARLLIERLL